MSDEERAAFERGWQAAIHTILRGFDQRAADNPVRVRSRRIEAQECAEMVASLLSESECKRTGSTRPKAEVRVAVVVDASGRWSASGWHRWSDSRSMSAAAGELETDEPVASYFVDALLDIPEAKDVRASAITNSA